MADCQSYCSHGGQCVLMPGHVVKHKSQACEGDPTACEWTDDEAISRAQADRLLMMRGPRGAAILAEQRLTEWYGRLRGWL